MTDVMITASKVGNVHSIPIEIGNNYFDAKFDTGAGVTVISASVFSDAWTDDAAQKMEDFCKTRGCRIEEFSSASGHIIKGFPVLAQNVIIGETTFPEFYYYFIVNGTRVVALIGDDFLENCQYSHEPHGDIHVTAFDFANYPVRKSTPIDNEDLLVFLDELNQNQL